MNENDPYTIPPDWLVRFDEALQDADPNEKEAVHQILRERLSTKRGRRLHYGGRSENAGGAALRDLGDPAKVARKLALKYGLTEAAIQRAIQMMRPGPFPGVSVALCVTSLAVLVVIVAAFLVAPPELLIRPWFEYLDAAFAVVAILAILVLRVRTISIAEYVTKRRFASQRPLQFTFRAVVLYVYFVKLFPYLFAAAIVVLLPRITNREIDSLWLSITALLTLTTLARTAWYSFVYIPLLRHRIIDEATARLRREQRSEFGAAH